MSQSELLPCEEAVTGLKGSDREILNQKKPGERLEKRVLRVKNISFEYKTKGMFSGVFTRHVSALKLLNPFVNETDVYMP